MTTLIYDIAAESGGALIILKMYHQKAMANANENERYVFVVSIPHLEENEYVKVLNFPKIKKSWFHRYFFDKKADKKLIEKYKPDLIINLQNVAINTDCEQVLYMHQPLPFIEQKFSLFRDPLLWVYQNIIGGMIKKSIKKVSKVIVQTKWTKDAILKKVKVSEDKITIETPEIDLSHVKSRKGDIKKGIYFYPASAVKYKNHKVIVEACKLLENENIFYEVNFTLLGNENKYISKLKKQTEKYCLKINWLGNLEWNEIFEWYSKSTLIFPSYVETFGLPLVEAAAGYSPVLAADTPFAKELLGEYSNVVFFKYNNEKELAELMK